MKYDTKSVPKFPKKKSAYEKVSQKFRKSGGGGVGPFWKKSTFNLHFFFEKLPKSGVRVFFTIKKDGTNIQYFLRDLVFAPLGLKCRILGLISPTVGLICPTLSPICPTFTGFILL